jgi:hypothetical protein
VREWVVCRRRESPLRAKPAEVLARLRRDPAFARFEKEGPHGEGLAVSAWRLAEAWAMASVAGVFGCAGSSCADSGKLSPEAEHALSSILDALGVSGSSAAALASIKDELTRETPYRERFFGVLAGRVASRRPLVLLAIAHNVAGGLSIEPRQSWAWTSFEHGKLRAVPADGAAAFEGTPEEFARRFVTENFL